MYKRIGTIAALVAAGWVAVAARGGPRPAGAAAGDTAADKLSRAWYAWDKGDYPAALTIYRDLLAGPEAAKVLEPIALQTGELFQTTELTRDGANPAFSPDSRYFSYETG